MERNTNESNSISFFEQILVTFQNLAQFLYCIVYIRKGKSRDEIKFQEDSSHISNSKDSVRLQEKRVNERWGTRVRSHLTEINY